jgi:hypothetical protein
MPKEPTFGFRKQQRLGRENNVKVEKPKKSAPSFSRQRFGMDPTISTSVSKRNAAALGAGKEYQGKALANDENKRQANMAGKMRQQMLNTRKANQFRAEQRRNAMRSRMRGAGRAGGAIAAGLGAVGAMSDALSMNEAQINKAKSQTRMQGAPSPMIPGNREQIVGQRQGRMFNERGQATSAKSVMPPKKGVMSKGTAGKTSTAKAGPSRAPITKALGIKK